jgi:hypothetical protein
VRPRPLALSQPLLALLEDDAEPLPDAVAEALAV